MKRRTVFFVIYFFANASCSTPPDNLEMHTQYANNTYNAEESTASGSDVIVQGSGTTTYRDVNGNIHSINRGPDSTVKIGKKGVLIDNSYEYKPQYDNSITISPHRYTCTDLVVAYGTNDNVLLKNIELYINGYLDSIEKNKPKDFEENLANNCENMAAYPLIEATKKIIATKPASINTRKDSTESKPYRSQNSSEVRKDNNGSTNNDGDQNGDSKININKDSTESKFYRSQNNSGVEKDNNGSTNDDGDSKFSCKAQGKGSSCNKGNGQTVTINRNTSKK